MHKWCHLYCKFLCTHILKNDVTIFLAISAQNKEGYYMCVCSEYYTGDYCENDKDECKDNEDFCQYQGTCTVSN